MKVKYKVESDNLCPNCAARIEEAVKKIDGVNDANLSFLTLKLKMELADDANEDFKDPYFKENRLAVFSDDKAFRYWSFWEYAEFLYKIYGKEIDETYIESLMQGFNFNKYENYILKDLSMGNAKKFYIIAALGLKLPF